MEKISTPGTPDSDESHLAFDLLNADGTSGSDGTPRMRRQRVARDLDDDKTGGERTPLIRQPLLRTIYQELSQLAAEADGVSEKVKRTINRQRQRLQGLIEDTTTAPRRLQSKITAPLDRRRKQFHGRIRKVVTGDPSKSVRLHLQEKRSKPPVMRMMDKGAFTVGVLTLIVSEFVLLEMPQRFWLWYSVIVPVLLLMRYPTYARRKWQFFYLDFCYYVQVCCILGIFILPHDCRLLKIIFMYSMGPLSWAVPLWRNSLVFHDVDKMTSCFIHLFPGWLCLTLRWWPIDTLRGGDGASEPECTSGINLADVWVSLCLYLVWQVLYYIKTEFHEKPRLDADPDIQTSLRWLTTTPKNPLHRAVLWFMRTIGVMRRDEIFDPSTTKTKIIFMGSQLVYTVVVCIPTPFLYNSKKASVTFAFVMFVYALWNSSNYYIEVFSRRYWQSLEAEAAAKAAVIAKKKSAAAAAAAAETGDGGAGALPIASASGVEDALVAGEHPDDEGVTGCEEEDVEVDDDPQGKLADRSFSGLSCGGSSGDESAWSTAVAAVSTEEQHEDGICVIRAGEDLGDHDGVEDLPDMAMADAECFGDSIEEVAVMTSDAVTGDEGNVSIGGKLLNGFPRADTRVVSPTPAHVSVEAAAEASAGGSEQSALETPKDF